MLLAIDTSGPFCSVALLDGDRLLERSENIGRGHAEHLIGMLEAVLDEAGVGWDSISRIACSTGPGSFTGLRVGLATARGLALALNCPCIGVTVFEAFAEKFGQSQKLCVAMDAKREQTWMQCFDETGLPVNQPAAVSIKEASAAVAPDTRCFVGSAAAIVAAQYPDGLVLDESPSPPIGALALCASSIISNEMRPKPLYLRAPDAKPQASIISGAVVA